MKSLRAIRFLRLSLMVLCGFFMAAGLPAAAAGREHRPLAPDEVPTGVAKSDWDSIRAAHEAGRHEVRAAAGGHEAGNPGQGWHTVWDGQWFLTQPAKAADGAWQWGLQLESYGFAGAEQTVEGKAAVKADGQRLTYQWDANVQEWYVNDQRGVEHGFTVAQRPEEISNLESQISNPLAFTLAVRGGLRPEISPNAQAVAFLDAAGAAVVNYSGLKVWDADGKVLPSHFAAAETVAETAAGAAPDRFRLLVDERGARYPLTVDPVAQQAYLKAENAGAGDYFGSSVAVSGNTVVIGAPNEDSNTTGVNSSPNEGATDAGAAYVFVRDGAGVWSQQAYLKASNTGAGDFFGRSVAVSGDTVVVGAGDEDSDATGVNAPLAGGPNTQGDNSASFSGAAYIFSRSGATWSQQAYLKASNTGAEDRFGSSVTISGDTVVVGAVWEDSAATGVNGSQTDNDASASGAAYVFTRTGAGWSQQAYLKASNTDAGDFFGNAVGISGETVVVGANLEDSNATGVNGNQTDNDALASGAAYVFTRSGATWSQRAYLKASNTGEGDEFGSSVGISGTSIVVGAGYEDSNATGVNAPLTGGMNTQADNSASFSGAAYVFMLSGATWSQQAYLKASNTGVQDVFGSSVGISGDTVVVGAAWERSNATGVNGPQEDNSALLSGAAYVFTRSGASWVQQAYLKASNTGANDRFGDDVAVSGEIVVVGSRLEDSTATGVNGMEADNSAPDAGAAYTFLFQPTFPSVITQPITAGSVTSTGATVNGRVFPNYSATTVTFEYGESPAGGLTTVAVPGTFSGSGPETASRALTGLLPGRTYRYRARAANGVGGAFLPAVAPFGFLEFTTAPAAPAVTTLAAASITSTGAVLNGTVSANGASAEVYFRYFAPGGEALNAVATPSPVTGTAVTAVSAPVTGLLPGTTYTFATRASNSVGDAPWGNLTFTTLPDPAVGGLAEPATATVAGGSLYGSVIQPDGKTLIFGDFTSVSGQLRGRMTRLLADGTLEGGLGFNPGANGDIVCAAVLADGKIMIGGNFTTLQPRGAGPVFTRSRLARLLSDGTVDTTFADPGVNAYVLCMFVDTFGRVIVGGDFNGVGSFMGATRNRMARIETSGALNLDFAPNVRGPVYAIAQRTNGFFLLGGFFNQVNGEARSNIAQLASSSGSNRDYEGSADGAVYSIALQRDDRAVVGGAFGMMNGTARTRLARLNTDGTLDTAFNPGVTGGDVFSIALQANQKMVLGGSFTSVGGTARNKVARVDAAGVLDGFNPNVTGGDVRSIALQANGKVQLGGTFTAINGGAAPRTAYALLSNETAYQTLEKRSATEIYWSRGGSAPEVLSVAFDQATFLGTVFTAVGTGTRVDPLAGDWRLSGISPSLPLSGQIRARARTASGYLSGSTGIMESKVAYIHTLPIVTTVSVTSITGTTALLTGTVDTSTLTAVPAFKLDTTTAYTQPLRIATPASVTGTASVTYLVTGLIPGTAYTFRATAENAGGRVDGTDLSFTTLSNLNAVYNTGTEVPATASSYTATGRQVNFTLNYEPTPGTTLMVVNNTGSAPIGGQFANLTQGQAVDLTFSFISYPFVAHYHGGTGNDLVLLWRNTRAVTWGWNNNGQLGLGTSGVDNRGTPADVAAGLLTGKTIVSLAGGFQHSVALAVDGTIATWGDNGQGQLGTGDGPLDLTYSLVPTAVEQGFLPPGIHPVAIAAGGLHTLALFSDGRVYGWGDNQYGQIGNNALPFDSTLPAWAKGDLSAKRVIGISAGEFHSLAVCDDGTVAAWGLGDSGQLGNGSTANQAFPVAVDLSDVPPGETFVAVAAGRWHSMALTSGGKVFTWGNNVNGQLGIGTTMNQNFPVLVTGLTANAIYGGGTYHSMAMRNDGQLVAWGTNLYGQLGTGALANSFTPVPVGTAWLGAFSVGRAVTADEHNLALRSDGKLYAWGLGNEGRLGDNNTGTHLQPVQMPVDASLLDPGDRWQSLASGPVCQHSMGLIAASLVPSATTLSAIVISDTEAILYGRGNAHGVPTNMDFDYGSTTGYGTSINATPFTLNGLTPDVVSASLTGLEPGATYHFRIKARRSGFATFTDDGDDLTFTTRSRLEMWRQQWYRTYENTGDAANTADPDDDGINNLLEFAFGLHPEQNSTGQLPVLQTFPDRLQYTFSEPATYMGLTYGAEWSTSLTAGSWTTLTGLDFPPNHLFRLSTTGLDRVFVRLRVTPR